MLSAGSSFQLLLQAPVANLWKSELLFRSTFTMLLLVWGLNLTPFATRTQVPTFDRSSKRRGMLDMHKACSWVEGNSPDQSQGMESQQYIVSKLP